MNRFHFCSLFFWVSKKSTLEFLVWDMQIAPASRFIHRNPFWAWYLCISLHLLEASCVWCHRWHASWLNAATSPSAYSSYSRAVRCRGPSWQWWKPLLQYCWILKHCLWSIRCIFSPAPVTLLPCQLNHLWTRGVCPIYCVSSLLCPAQLWL